MYTNRATTLTALFVLGFASAALAQDPVRMPAMVVKAPVDKPGPRALSGVVRDTFALTIDSVEISIPSLQRRAFSDGNGKFRFDKISPGNYLVRARKIGYAPQTQTVTVDSMGGVGMFDLLQLRRALPPVIATAARGGLSGVVGDTSFRAVAGAEVRLLGNGQRVETDSLGYFFFPVRQGRYVVSVRQKGFTDRVVSVNVPADSGRRVTLFLEPGHGTVANVEYWNIDDFGQRLAWRNNYTSTFFTHDDMVNMGIEWITDAVQSGSTRAGGRQILDADCSAVLNGGPGTVRLAALTIDDVESVEVYPTTGQNMAPTSRPNTVGRPVGKKGVADSKVKIPIANTGRTASVNQGLVCAMVYVWTR